MDGIISQELLEHVLPLQELKMHLRIDSDLEDAYLISLARAAIDFAENYTKRFILERQKEIILDSLPSSPLMLPNYPVQEILQITYQNTEGNSVEVPSTTYQTMLNVEPPMILIASWPQSTGPFRIHALVGYKEVPMSIKQAILLLSGHFYENREVMRDRYVHSYEMPFSVTALLYPYKILRW